MNESEEEALDLMEDLAADLEAWPLVLHWKWRRAVGTMVGRYGLQWPIQQETTFKEIRSCEPVC